MVQRAVEAELKCNVLKMAPSKACHHNVDPLDHYTVYSKQQVRNLWMPGQYSMLLLST